MKWLCYYIMHRDIYVCKGNVGVRKANGQIHEGKGCMRQKPCKCSLSLHVFFMHVPFFPFFFGSCKSRIHLCFITFNLEFWPRAQTEFRNKEHKGLKKSFMMMMMMMICSLTYLKMGIIFLVYPQGSGSAECSYCRRLCY